MIFDVEKARRLVGPLDVPADLVEVPALVAEECPFGDAGMGLAAFLYHRKQRRQITGCKIFRTQLSQAIVEHVELNPHLGGDQRPQCASVLARVADCADDRGRIVAVDDIKVHDAVRSGRVVAGEKTLLIRVQLDDRPPVLTAAAVAREGLVDVENPCEVLGALDITREPEDAIRVAGEQDVRQRPRYPWSRRPATNLPPGSRGAAPPGSTRRAISRCSIR